jgi:hypothetical protein
MFRTSDIVLIAVMVAAAAMTYTIKRNAELQVAVVHKLKAQIHTEEDTIDLLKADWSLLTQPERLQKLAAIYQSQLELAPVTGHQIVGLDQLPPRTLTIEELMAEQPNAAANGKDAIVTGGIQ